MLSKFVYDCNFELPSRRKKSFSLFIPTHVNFLGVFPKYFLPFSGFIPDFVVSVLS